MYLNFILPPQPFHKGRHQTVDCSCFLTEYRGKEIHHPPRICSAPQEVVPWKSGSWTHAASKPCLLCLEAERREEKFSVLNTGIDACQKQLFKCLNHIWFLQTTNRTTVFLWGMLLVRSKLYSKSQIIFQNSYVA